MLHLKIFTMLLMVSILSSCATLTPNFEQPDLQVTSLTLLPLNGLEQRFRLGFRVVNPNNIELPIDGMSFTLNLRDLKVATGVSDKAFILKPLGESTFEVTVSASLLNTGRVLLDIINAKPKELAYEIDAKIFTNKGLFGSIPVSRSGIIPFKVSGNQL
ncbi:LEA type 2 family protein [Aliiglaciecola sp. M165]|uniref:LEA type 2 family protein n=1 Tax=Aliiglaciecola sp. M165 TaxID=2593649 RepID=UPI0011804059|nr:LEA type 2 family protein [Aliiglaciecola sp. M165]TRY29358.1 LEA type 2 family protein [Aliiglaciecola sp. M165]